MDKPKVEKQSKLEETADLFKVLREIDPAWWKSLVADPEIYIDIRRDGHIDAYYKGGCLMKLSYGRGFKAEIRSEYIPLNVQSEQVKYAFDGEKISLASGIEIAPLDDFPNWLAKVKKRIGLFNPPQSEKAIQADYVLRNPYFIDTEFCPEGPDARIDLVWLEPRLKKIFFVELKTIGNPEIYCDLEAPLNEEKIEGQLRKYRELLKDRDDIRAHYMTLFQLKKRLKILPAGCEGLNDISDFTLEERPVFLVGDCTRKWIQDNAPKINESIRATAYAAIYHGRTYTKFAIPDKTEGYKWLFPESEASTEG